jgi:hypothetical protein
MLPRNWSVPCEVAEMRYKFKIKCWEGFQLVDPSEFGLSLPAITLSVKNFNTASFILQSQNIFLLQIDVQIKQIRKIPS